MNAMKSFRHILIPVILCAIALGLCACRSTTFAEHFSIRDIQSAASLDIPAEGQYNVDGEAVLAVLNHATPDGSDFTPATLLTIFDGEGTSHMFYFSKDRRKFAFNGTGWRLTRRQARAVDKMI